MASETDLTIGDYVTAELVDCLPPEAAPSQAVQIPGLPPPSPVERAAEATIGQTGADPPPEGLHG